MFAAFALSPRSGGVPLSQAVSPLPPAATQRAPPPPPPQQQQQEPDPERDAWAASTYDSFTSSPLLSPSLDPRLPTVPVILHPSARRGAVAPPVTARHLGFLRCDLTGEGVGPGRFFPLFPEDAAEAEVGVDTGSLDRFGCTGHWASSGCIRLLAVSTASAASAGAAGGSGLALMPLEAFATLWARGSSGGSSAAGSSGAEGPGGACSDEAAAAGTAAAAPAERDAAAAAPAWHVPYPRLLPLEEAYGGLCRELKAIGADLTHAHYMLRGWKTREGRQRLGGSGGPRPPPPGAPRAPRQRRGVVPAEIAATRELRAMINWPGLLELLEEEGVECVPTDGVRYWLARLGAEFQGRLAAAGVLCADSTVHHIIARSSRGIDHPLNYFLVDRGPNSAMGSRVEGFRDASGAKLHMRDVVGERAFEVAQAACNLYHGVLYMGRQRGEPLSQTLRQLREGAFASADEAIAARREREERRAVRAGTAAAAGVGAAAEGAVPGGDAAAVAAAAAASPAAVLQGREQQQLEQAGGSSGQKQPGMRSSLKRERCQEQQLQQQGEAAGWGECVENTPLNNATCQALSPTQQQQGRRRRLSGQLYLAASVGPSDAAAGAAAAVTAAAAVATAVQATAAGAQEVEVEEAAAEHEAEEGLAALSLCCSPDSMGIVQAAGGRIEETEVQQGPQQQQEAGQQQGQRRDQPKPGSKPAGPDLGSLRARLRAALGVV